MTTSPPPMCGSRSSSRGTDLDTLQRWVDQAVLAANVGEALQ